MIDAYTLVFGGLMLLGGRAADLVGRNRMFVTGLAIFSAAGLAGGLANTAGLLIAARAVQGPAPHHQDIRRPLGHGRAIPADRLLSALRTAMIAPDIGGLWRTRGVRLVATDLDFSAGTGPEARGPAEALLMTIAGRRGVAGELSGPGQSRLERRIGG